MNSIMLPVHAATTTEDATTTPDPRCSITAGCKEIWGGHYATFAQDLYEGDFFASGKALYVDSGCGQTPGDTFGPLVIARTEAGAFDIFTENGVSNSQPEAAIDQGGECQIWFNEG